MGCRAARDLQAGIVEAKSSTAKADTSGTGFGVSPVTVADFSVQCLLLGALAQRLQAQNVPLDKSKKEGSPVDPRSISARALMAMELLMASI